MQRFSYYSRELGVLFFGGYYGGNSLYFAFNFHWEPHVFYLPEIEKNKEWKRVFDTSHTMEMAVDGKKYERHRAQLLFLRMYRLKTAGTSDKKKIPAKGIKMPKDCGFPRLDRTSQRTMFVRRKMFTCYAETLTLPDLLLRFYSSP